MVSTRTLLVRYNFIFSLSLYPMHIIRNKCDKNILNSIISSSRCNVNSPFVCTYHLLTNTTSTVDCQLKQYYSSITLSEHLSRSICHTQTQYIHLYQTTYTNGTILIYRILERISSCQKCKFIQYSFNIDHFHSHSSCSTKSYSLSLICIFNIISLFYSCDCSDGS